MGYLNKVSRHVLLFLISYCLQRTSIIEYCGFGFHTVVEAQYRYGVGFSSSHNYYSSDIAALTGLICSSATLALVLGSELHHHQTGVPPDHTHISALIRSAVRILNSTFKGDNILLKTNLLWIS